MKEILFKYRWCVRIIYVLIIIGLLLVLRPSLSDHLRKEEKVAETILAVLKKYDELNKNDEIVLFNNHEFLFKYSDYEDVVCVSNDSNAKRLCSHIAGRIWYQETSSMVYFIIACDRDMAFHPDSVDFIKGIRSRSLSSNIKLLKELELKANKLGDIVMTSTKRFNNNIIKNGGSTHEKTED